MMTKSDSFKPLLLLTMLTLFGCPNGGKSSNSSLVAVPSGNERVDDAMDKLTNGGTTLPSGERLTEVINNTNPNQTCSNVTNDEPQQSNIISRDDWGAQSFKKDSSFPCMDYKALMKQEIGNASGEDMLKKIYRGGRIVIHHAAGPSGGVDKVKRVQKDHQSTGYQDVKYHFLIDSYGKTYEGRKLDLMGAHAGALKKANGQNLEPGKGEYICQGKNKIQYVNEDYDFKAIGIMLVGNLEVSKPSKAQYAALKSLVANLKSRFNINDISPHMHVRKNGGTSCPGKHLIAGLAAETGIKFTNKPSSRANLAGGRSIQCSAPSVSCQ